MNEKTVIVWFRRDLRLQDNDALSAAIEAANEQKISLTPVFIFDAESPFAPGAASRWWLFYALKELKEELAQLGLKLKIFSGKTEEILRKLSEKSSGIFCNRTYEPDEEIFLKSFGEKLHAFDANVLFPPSTTKPYQVFTPFYRYCLSLEFRKPVVAWLSGIKDLKREAEFIQGEVELENLNLLPKIPWDKGLEKFWDFGGKTMRQWALERLKEMSMRDSNYKARRDFLAEDATSRLSPFLAWGQIGPREMAEKLGRESAFLRQVFWREFAIHMLFRNPQMALGKPLRAEWERFPWKEDARIFEAWKKGKTGYPLVDAGMRQLWATGWMHNRARMVVASFLVKNALVPWQQGERWFWETLVDADLANNVFGWQWVAGCGADAAPYFRVFNPTLQKEKFDPEEKYCRTWIAELGTMEYPEPIVKSEEGRARALAAYEEFKTKAATNP